LEGTPDLSGWAFKYADRCRMNAAFRCSIQCDRQSKTPPVVTSDRGRAAICDWPAQTHLAAGRKRF
jgi:hypothetical protein